MKISVITPTANRSKLLPGLYHSFAQQTWEDRELIVLDASANPDQAFIELTKGDARVRYIHSRAEPSRAHQRRRLLEEATGEFVAHFFDADFYAPLYLERHVANLNGCQIVALRSAFSFHLPQGFFAYWKPQSLEPTHFTIDGNRPIEPMSPFGKITLFDCFEFVWSNGFSYMYNRKAALEVGFDPGVLPEDYHFFRDFRSRGNGAACYDDSEGLALHFLFGKETAIQYPQYRIPEEFVRLVFGKGIDAFFDRLK